jgi:hypothetical protein
MDNYYYFLAFASSEKAQTNSLRHITTGLQKPVS